MANDIRGVSPSGTLYARVMNSAGRWWNGASFEVYSAGNYSTYDIAMTEQGDSGVYVADFPTGITQGGTYEYYIHLQDGGSPAEGDQVIGTGSIDWTGSSASVTASGSMSGSDFYAYILRLGFKRTDKSTEVYEAVTDAVQDMRTRFGFSEAQTETTTTDTISVDGDYKIDVEDDFGMVVGLVVEDDDTATPLTKISKKQFDALYPDANVTTSRGFPKHFCIYGEQILIGPIPDDTAYVYRASYSKRGGTVAASTTAVPFTTEYRAVLAQNVLMRLYRDVLSDYQKGEYHEAKFKEGFLLATRKESMNSGSHFFQQRVIDC